ncbi:MAG: phosphatase PAP2 family protein [Cardiobacteriaceae bacterium]|nr:phosphatase PAP2 family protein [Cardiobacteriaceae bacterium]
MKHGYLVAAALFAGIVAALAATLPEPFPFETALIRAAGAARGGWQETLALVLHYIGKYAVFFVPLLGAAYFWRGQRRMAAYVVAVPGLAALASSALKHAFARVRPDILPHLVDEGSASFPSGHSTFAAAFALLFILRHPRPAVIVAGALFILAMGWSRLLLGVHYPVDVLAGWSVGAAMACAGYALLSPKEKSKNPFL